MEELIVQTKKVLMSKQVRRGLWTMLGAVLPVLAVYLGEIDWYWAPLLIAIITGATKEINNNYGK